MAIDANSYGSVEGVAALSRRWTNASQGYDNTTKPTRAQIEAWIDQVSSVINVTMAGCRYTSLPITVTTVTKMFDLYVNQIVADMVEGSHDIGRLGPTALANRGTGETAPMWAVVAGEVATFIKSQCDSFEYLGVVRDAMTTSAGRLKTQATKRQDGYSDDVDAWETTGLV